MRLDRERGGAATLPLGSGSWARRVGGTGWDARPGEERDSTPAGISSGTGRPIMTTVDLSRALGARTPW